MHLPLDRQAWAFGLPPFVVGVLLLGFGLTEAWSSLWTWAGAAILLLSLGILLFFRDPDRRPEPLPADCAPEDVLLSPADGRVVRVGETPSPEEEAPAGSSSALSIFLSLFDIHVNRAPSSGEVQDVTYRSGRYQAAFRATASAANERNQITLDTRHGPLIVRQVAGLVARRIVCRVRPGQRVAQGQRIGLIRFGSRVDLFLDEERWEWTVGVGDRVRGGATVVARRSRDAGTSSPQGEITR